MTPEILSKTKCYLCGNMQYTTMGRPWREDMTSFLRALNVTVLDPYQQLFTKNDVAEDETTHDRLLNAMRNWQFDAPANVMKEVRARDLACVDRADFIIYHLQPTVPTFGSMEEFSWAIRLKKPCFVVVEGGKEKTPLWVMGMLPHKYLYSSFQHVKNVLSDIHSGKHALDNERWRLLQPHLR